MSDLQGARNVLRLLTVYMPPQAGQRHSLALEESKQVKVGVARLILSLSSSTGFLDFSFDSGDLEKDAAEIVAEIKALIPTLTVKS